MMFQNPLQLTRWRQLFRLSTILIQMILVSHPWAMVIAVFLIGNSLTDGCLEDQKIKFTRNNPLRIQWCWAVLLQSEKIIFLVLVGTTNSCRYGTARTTRWEICDNPGHFNIFSLWQLSFKLWLCGGKLLEVPCSRVSHLFRYKNKNRSSPNYDYVAHNFKRLAEVWFGDFKHCLYSTDPGKYEKIDAGDLTRAKQIRKSLNCKPFQYFLEHIMPDQMFRYPCNPGVFASGFIQSEAYPDLCVDTLHTDIEVGLYECSKNRTRPGKHQHFELSWHRQIIKVPKHFNHCLDTHKTRFYECHFGLGTQFWFYNTVGGKICPII